MGTFFLEFLFYPFISDGYGVFDEDKDIEHGSKAKQHPNTEVVHEAQVVLDDSTECFSHIKSHWPQTAHKCNPLGSVCRIGYISHVSIHCHEEAHKATCAILQTLNEKTKTYKKDNCIYPHGA